MDERDRQDNELEAETETLNETIDDPEEPAALDDYDVEAASEIAAPGLGDRNNLAEPERAEVEQEPTMEGDVDNESVGRGLGITALILSICSLFFLPVITGIIGIVLGFFAARRGSRGMGYWAIGLGAVSILMTLFFAPFF